MKCQNWLLLVAIVLLTALPLWLVEKPAPGPDGKVAEIFSGSDGQGQQAISELAPNYQPWFESFLTPASKEIESLLFALQAAFGAGIIGYWLGASVTREKMREKMRREAERRAAAQQEIHAD
jgi:cobalt/nickel transport protein